MSYSKTITLPWNNCLLRHRDASLEWNLYVRLIKIILAAGIHDNDCYCLILHHVEQLLSSDATSRHGTLQTKILNQQKTVTF